MNVLKTKKAIFAALGTAAALLTVGANAFAQVTYGGVPAGITYGGSTGALTYGDYSGYGQADNGLVYGQTSGSTIMEQPVSTYVVTPSLTYDGPVAVTPQYQVIAQSYDANMDVCDARVNVYNNYTYNVYAYNSFTSSLVYQGQQSDGPYFQTTVDTSYNGPCQ